MKLFSKIWRGFTVFSIIFVLIFIAGIVGLLAQTLNDDGIGEDKVSSDTAKEKGLFGTSISIGDLDSIGGFVGGITALIVAIVAGIRFLIRRRQPSIQILLATSEDISKFLRDRQSNEFSRVEKVVKNVERNPKASFVEKTMADAYRLQQNGRIDEARQKWRALADYAERKDDTLAKRAGVSIGYLLSEGGITHASQSNAPNLKPDDTEADVYRGLGKYAGEGIVIGAVLRYFNNHQFNKYFTALEYRIGSGLYRADVALLNKDKQLTVIVECKRIGYAVKSGISELYGYLRGSNAQFGIFAADTDPSKWTFSKMVGNEIIPIDRSEFEKEITKSESP